MPRPSEEIADCGLNLYPSETASSLLSRETSGATNRERLREIAKDRQGRGRRFE